MDITVIQRPRINDVFVCFVKILQSGRKPSANNGFWNIVASLCHSHSDSAYSNFSRRQRKKPKLDLITQLLPKFDFPHVANTRERSFKSETLSSEHALINFFKHQAACFDSC